MSTAFPLPHPSLIISEVQTRSDRDSFITCPWAFYKDDPYWIPPLIEERRTFLDPRRNPFFDHAKVALFLARRGKKVVGRISASVDSAHNSFHEEKTAFFGFFETIKDYDVARELLERATDWARSQGMDQLRGPCSFTTNHECGLLVEGFQAFPSLKMPYNTPDYAGFLEKFGFKKTKDLYAYRLTDQGISPRLGAVVERIRQRSGAEVRPIRMKAFDEEVQIIRNIYNQAWSRNWGFVPLSEAEFKFVASSMRPLVNPDLLLIVSIAGEPVGFSLILPDINPALKRANGRLFPLGFLKLWWYGRRISQVRVITLGIIPKYQKLGLDALLYWESCCRGGEKGFREGEMSWVLEDNLMMNRAAELLGGQRTKTYRIYDLPLRNR